MSTFYEPLERNVWSKDRQGVPWTSKHKDSVETYDVDFSDKLASGETISTRTVTASGVTVTSNSIVTGLGGSSTAVRLTGVTGTDGHVKVKVVTSDSKTFIREVRFRGVPIPGPESDY